MTSPCDTKTDDNCASQVVGGVQRRPTDADFETSCTMKQTTCGVTCHAGDPSLSACAISQLYSDSVVAMGKACETVACTDYCACLNTAFQF